MLMQARMANLIARQATDLAVQDVFDINLWTGSSATRSINTPFAPDLVWIKARSNTYSHDLFDTARGPAKYLRTNMTAAETSGAQTLTAFNSNGYSLGADATGGTNTVPESYIGWAFKKAAKFLDVVAYTGDGVSGRTILHALGVQPGLIVIKRTDAAENWMIAHHYQGANFLTGLALNTTDGSGFTITQANTFNDTYFKPYAVLDPSLGSINGNWSGATYVAYLFAHDPSGIVQCGSYTGNGSTTGPTIDLGWEPQFVLFKRVSAAQNWVIVDRSRGFTTVANAPLKANLSSAELSQFFIQPLSTGFQPITRDSEVNASGHNYIYMAIRRGPM
jgi:hypothetical protein